MHFYRLSIFVCASINSCVSPPLNKSDTFSSHSHCGIFLVSFERMLAARCTYSLLFAERSLCACIIIISIWKIHKLRAQTKPNTAPDPVTMTRNSWHMRMHISGAHRCTAPTLFRLSYLDDDDDADVEEAPLAAKCERNWDKIDTSPVEWRGIKGFLQTFAHHLFDNAYLHFAVRRPHTQWRCVKVYGKCILRMP